MGAGPAAAGNGDAAGGGGGGGGGAWAAGPAPAVAAGAPHFAQNLPCTSAPQFAQNAMGISSALKCTRKAGGGAMEKSSTWRSACERCGQLDFAGHRKFPKNSEDQNLRLVISVAVLHLKWGETGSSFCPRLSSQRPGSANSAPDSKLTSKLPTIRELSGHPFQKH